jgi:hypothetical protein
MFRILGIVILLIVLKVLMSDVWGAFEDTLLAFFSTTQTALEISETHYTAGVGFIPRVE